MAHLFDISSILSTYGYLGIFIIVFIESGIFFALPGDSLIFAAGILASSMEKAFLLISLIFIATLLGSIIGYYIGSHLERFAHLPVFRRILKKEYIDQAREFFSVHGKKAVAFSRFIPIVRTFVPIVAGIGRMPKKIYLIYNIVGSFLWATVIPLMGYYLGRAFPQIEKYMVWIIIFIVIFSILPGILGIIHRKKFRL